MLDGIFGIKSWQSCKTGNHEPVTSYTDQRPPFSSIGSTQKVCGCVPCIAL